MLDAARDDLASMVDHDNLYFYISVRKERYDDHLTGEAVLEVRGQARDGVAVAWCNQYNFPKSFTF